MEGTSKDQETFNLASQMDIDKNENAAVVVADNNNEADMEQDLHLTLGLSLNGTYGVDPACKKLKRSSSISNLAVSDAADVARDEHAPIARAVSEPVDSEEEVRRRKADQSARRLEVKKKLHWKKSKFARGIVIDNNDNNNATENIGVGGNVETTDQAAAAAVVVHQGYVGSQKTAGSSSGVYGRQQIIEGAAQTGKEKIPSSVPSVEMQLAQSLKVHAERAPPMPANAPGRNDAPATDGRRNNRALVSTPLMDMPFVSTRGGTNMVRGFLYKYDKGEDMKIVCVCHGAFFTPAQFVRHGGGGEVDNPLKHIIMNSTPLY